MKRIVTYMALALMLIGVLQPITHIPEVPEVQASTHVKSEPVREETKQQHKEAHAISSVTPQLEPTPPVAPPVPKDAQTITWEYFISKGFTPNQTAGIMGNLQQEHNFSTSDVPGGLGIAQWMGGRRSNLLAKPAPFELTTQLDFIMEEFQAPRTLENKAYNLIKSSDNLVSSTIAFQNFYERCGNCKQPQRIQYAINILGRFAP